MTTHMAIGSALYGRLGTVSYSYYTNGTVPTTGTLGCYDTLAPQETPVPYVVYQLATSLDNYTFGTNSGESFDYLVKVVSDRLFPSMQGYQLYEQAHSALQDAPLNIMGSYLLRCRRTSRVAPVRDAEGYWHVGAFYRIDVWSS